MYPVAALSNPNGFGRMLYDQFSNPRAQLEVINENRPFSRSANTGERISTNTAIIIGSAAPVRVSDANAASDISAANPSVSIKMPTSKALQLTPVFIHNQTAVGTIATHNVAM